VTSPASPGKSEIRNPASEPAPLLVVEDLRVELPVGGSLRAAVDGVSFSLSAGESVALVGESGCGKTQLARAILGLAPEGGRLSGRIAFEGQDLLRLGDRQWRRVRGAGVGLVFQEPAAALDPVRTIGEQIIESLRLHRRLSRSAARRLASAALREVGFPDPEAGLDEYAHRLSGGLRQRALLAATLAPGPRLLLADEPTASLDATVAAQVLALLDRLRRERSLTVLLITHDLGVVARHCDRVLVLYAGRVVEEARTADLFPGACHPYTRGLLRSVPRLASAGPGPGRRFEAIPGTLADLSARRGGACAFAPRCADRFEPCDRREPGFYPTPIGEARCFLYDAARGGGRA
jgi:oligopeptide/dipeptide ABC transporter ATP-binding protein